MPLPCVEPESGPAKPNLIYTVAFDMPGWRGGRTMAKLLTTSLLRQFWSGQIIVFRNFVDPLFPVERKGLEEIFIDTENFPGTSKGEACLKAALEFRFLAASHIDASLYEWISYVDADCLALRNLDHLFHGDADILVQPERGRKMRDSHVFNGYLTAGEPRMSQRNAWLARENADGINAGTLAVRSHCYAEVMSEWRRIYESEPAQHAEMRDQTAWNRLLLDTDLRVMPFERGEIAFPFTLNPGFLDYKQAALLHFLGGGQRDKVELAFALHMMKTYSDPGGLFLDLLES